MLGKTGYSSGFPWEKTPLLTSFFGYISDTYKGAVKTYKTGPKKGDAELEIESRWKKGGVV